MYVIYTKTGQVRATTTKQVVQHLHSHSFEGIGDYFTVERSGLDLLEVIFAGKGFRLGYIPVNEDEAQYMPDQFSPADAEQAVVAFCEGFLNWMEPATAETAGAENANEPRPEEAARQNDRQSIHVSADPIHPKGCGSSLILWMILTILLVVFSLNLL